MRPETRRRVRGGVGALLLLGERTDWFWFCIGVTVCFTAPVPGPGMLEPPLRLWLLGTIGVATLLGASEEELCDRRRESSYPPASG